MSEFVSVRINGERREVPAAASVGALLVQLGIVSGRVAIERNFSLLPRSEWDTTLVAPGDQYEIVHLVGGG